MERSRNGSNRSRRSAASSLVAAEAPVPTWWRDVKEWTRKTVAFLFGHVGICVLVVGYIIVGAFAFMSIEKEDVNDTFMQAARERDNCVQRLWRITEQFNVLSRDNWTAAVQMEIVYYQEEIVKLVQEGYDSHNYTSDVPSTEGPSTGTQWSFSAAFLYCLTVITTIGYGNITPHTGIGKLVTILYAMVGMPLFLLYVANMGDVLATGFRWGYVKLCKCDFAARRRRNRRAAAMAAAAATVTAVVHQGVPFDDAGRRSNHGDGTSIASHYVVDDDDEPTGVDYQTATVPITISLTVMVSYVCGGAMLFGQWEDWDFLEGSYFCFISLSTTGFGDYVPGDSFNSSSGVELSLIFCSMYLIIGMALIAMCFNLMQEEVIAKMRRCGQILGCIREDRT